MTPTKKVRPAKPAAGVPAEVVGPLPGETVPRSDLYWEERVAAWLGVPRRRVTALRLRGLREGQHWRLHDRQVVYTLSGVQSLRDYLQQLQPARQAEAEPSAMPDPGPPQQKSARVVRCYPNSRLLLARVEANGERQEHDVIVVVRDNSNFLPGMRLSVVHDVRANRWQFCGRMPRRKGRW